MKRISILAVAALVLLAAPVMAQDSTKTLVGYGVGFGGDETFTYGFAGKVFDVLGGHLIPIVQYGGKNGSEAEGFGAGLIFSQPLKVCNDLHLLFNLGALDGVAQKADGSFGVGANGGVGVALLVTDNMGFHAWGRWRDTGSKLSGMGYGGVHIKDPGRLAAPVFSLTGKVLSLGGKALTFVGEKVF